MKVFWSSFLPVSRTFSALITTTKSPVSTCGVKIAFSLPRRRFAAFTATRPRTWFWASIIHHLRGTSLALAENVFIGSGRARKVWVNERGVNRMLGEFMALNWRVREREGAAGGTGPAYNYYNALLCPFSSGCLLCCHFLDPRRRWKNRRRIFRARGHSGN